MRFRGVRVACILVVGATHGCNKVAPAEVGTVDSSNDGSSSVDSSTVIDAFAVDAEAEANDSGEIETSVGDAPAICEASTEDADVAICRSGAVYPAMVVYTSPGAGLDHCVYAGAGTFYYPCPAGKLCSDGSCRDLPADCCAIPCGPIFCDPTVPSMHCYGERCVYGPGGPLTPPDLAA